MPNNLIFDVNQLVIASLLIPKVPKVDKACDDMTPGETLDDYIGHNAKNPLTRAKFGQIIYSYCILSVNKF